MKRVLKTIYSLHDFTYIFITSAILTAILTIILAIYYIIRMNGVINSIYYIRTATHLLISVRDMLIMTAVFSALSEFVIRHK